MLFIFNMKNIIHSKWKQYNRSEATQHIKHNKLFTYKWTWYFRNNEDALKSKLNTTRRWNAHCTHTLYLHLDREHKKWKKISTWIRWYLSNSMVSPCACKAEFCMANPIGIWNMQQNALPFTFTVIIHGRFESISEML